MPWWLWVLVGVALGAAAMFVGLGLYVGKGFRL